MPEPTLPTARPVEELLEQALTHVGDAKDRVSRAQRHLRKSLEYLRLICHMTEQKDTFLFEDHQLMLSGMGLREIRYRVAHTEGQLREIYVRELARLADREAKNAQD